MAQEDDNKKKKVGLQPGALKGYFNARANKTPDYLQLKKKYNPESEKAWISEEKSKEIEESRAKLEGNREDFHVSHTSSGYSSRANSNGNEDGQKGQGTTTGKGAQKKTSAHTPKHAPVKKHTSYRKPSDSRALPGGQYRLGTKGAQKEEEYDQEQAADLDRLATELNSRDQEETLEQRIAREMNPAMASDATYVDRTAGDVQTELQAVQDKYDEYKETQKGYDTADYLTQLYKEGMEKGDMKEFEEARDNAINGANNKPVNDWIKMGKVLQGLDKDDSPFVNKRNAYSVSEQHINSIVDEAINSAMDEALNKAFQDAIADVPVNRRPKTPQELENGFSFNPFSKENEWSTAKMIWKRNKENIQNYLLPEEVMTKINDAITNTYSGGALTQAQQASGLTENQYWNNYVIPEIQKRIETRLVGKNIPKNWFDLAENELKSSQIYKWSSIARKKIGTDSESNVNREFKMLESANKKFAEGTSDYKPSSIGKFAAGAVPFVADALIFKGLGKGAGLLSRPVVGGLLKIGASDFTANAVGSALGEGFTFGAYSGLGSIADDLVQDKEVDLRAAAEKTILNLGVGAAMGAFGAKTKAVTGEIGDYMASQPYHWGTLSQLALKGGSKAIDFTGRTMLMGMGSAAEQMLEGVDPKQINYWECMEGAAEMMLMGTLTNLPGTISEAARGNYLKPETNMQLNGEDIQRLNDAGIKGKNSYQIRQNLIERAKKEAAQRGTRHVNDAFIRIISEDIIGNKTLGTKLKNKVGQALGVKELVPDMPVCTVSKPMQPDSQHNYWRVATYDQNGRIVETKRFKNQTEANTWHAQMEEVGDKNTLDILDAMVDGKAQLDALNESLKEVATKNGLSNKDLFELIENVNEGKELTEKQKAIMKEARENSAKYKESAKNDSDKAKKSVDNAHGRQEGWTEKALKKSIRERDAEEQRAVEEYKEQVKKSLSGQKERDLESTTQEGHAIYNDGNLQEMRNTRLRMEEAKRRLAESLQSQALVDEIDATGNAPAELTKNQQKLLREYLNAKNRYQAMEEARMDAHQDQYDQLDKVVRNMNPTVDAEGNEVVRLVERADGNTYVVLSTDKNEMLLARVDKDENGNLDWSSVETNRKNPQLVRMEDRDQYGTISTEDIMGNLMPEVVAEDHSINDAIDPYVGQELRIENEDKLLENATIVGQDQAGNWIVAKEGKEQNPETYSDDDMRALIDQSERNAINNEYANQQYEKLVYGEEGKPTNPAELEAINKQKKTPEPKFKKDKNGNDTEEIDTQNTPMEDTIGYLVNATEGEAGLAQRIVSNKMEKIRKEIDKLREKKWNVDNVEEVKRIQNEIAEKSRELDYWNSINENLTGVENRPEEMRTETPATEVSQENVAILQNAIGAKIVFVDSIEEMRKLMMEQKRKMGKSVDTTKAEAGLTNGFYDNGDTIYINRASYKQRGINWIFGHESGHALDKQNHKAYLKLKAAVLSTMDPLYIGQRMREIKGNDIYSKLTDDELLTEIVNDYIGEVLRDNGKLDIIAHQVNKSTLNWLGRVVADFKDHLNGMNTADLDVTEKNLIEAYKTCKKLTSTEPKDVNQQEEIHTDDGTMAAALTKTNTNVVDFGAHASQETLIGTDGEGYFTDEFGQRHKCTRDKLVEYLEKKGASKEDIEAFKVRMDYYANYFRDLMEFTDVDGKIIFPKFVEWNKKQPSYKVVGKKIQKAVSSLVKNGEYAVNLDLTTDCIKREAFTQVLNILTKRNPDYWRKMTPAKIKGIEKIMKKNGLQTACDLCFVEGKRLNIVTWANNFVKDWNDCLQQYMGQEGYANAESFGFGSGEYVPQNPMSVLNKEMYRQSAKIINDAYERYTDGSGMDTEIRDLVLANEAKYEKRYEEMEMDWYRTHDSEEAFAPNKDQMEELQKIYNEGVSKVKDKMMQAIRQYPELRKKMAINDLLGSDGLMTIRKESGKSFERLYSLILSRGGTSTPKIVQDAEPYVGELLDVTDTQMNKANKEGGARMHSFSDGDPFHMIDNMQIIWDADARKAKIQSYNKEIPFILQFGQTGVKINMSMLPEAIVSQQMKDEYWSAPKSKRNAIAKKNSEYVGLRRDRDGHIVGFTWSGTHSITPEFANAIFHDSRYNANCGAIAVGIGVNHAIWLCGTDYIRQVIPFYLSGMPVPAREMSDVMWYKDFTKDQNTQVKINGRWVSIKGKAAKAKHLEDFDFYADEDSENWDMRRKTADYVKWCKDNGFKPRFSWCVNSDGYKTWCKNNGFKADQQVVDMMDAHTIGGVFDGYYKVLTDFTAYQPEFDANGKMIGEKSAPHRPVDSSKLAVGEDIENLLYGKTDSMLANREKNLKYQEANLPKVADQVEAYLKGEITDEDIEAMEGQEYGYQDDNDIYMKYASGRADKQASFSVETDQRYYTALEQNPQAAAEIVAEEARKYGLPEDEIKNLKVKEYDQKKVEAAKKNLDVYGSRYFTADKQLRDFVADLIQRQGITGSKTMRADNVDEWISYAPEQDQRDYRYLAVRRDEAQAKADQAQAEMEAAKEPLPLSQRKDLKPKLTDENVCMWLYKNYPEKELHDNLMFKGTDLQGNEQITRGRRMLGAFWHQDGSYDYEVAADDYRVASDVLGRYKEKLQNLGESYNITPTAQRVIDNVIDDIDYALDYYRQCAIDKTTQRRMDAPKFSQEEVAELATATPAQRIFWSNEGYRGAKRLDEWDMGNRIENLNVAKAMEKEGKYRTTIRLATGWEKGADGEWRLETDNDVRFTPESIERMIEAYQNGYSLKIRDVIQDHELLKAYEGFGDLKLTPLRQNPNDRGAYNESNKEIKVNIRDVDNRLALLNNWKSIYAKVPQEDKDLVHWMENYDKNENPTNADKRKWQSSLEKYEEINNRVRAIEGEYGRNGLSLTQLEDTIELHQKLLEKEVEELESTLNHEVQHYIQYREGFAHGGNNLSVRDDIKNKLDDIKIWKDSSEEARTNYEWAEKLINGLEFYKQVMFDDDAAIDWYRKQGGNVNESNEDRVLKEIRYKASLKYYSAAQAFETGDFRYYTNFNVDLSSYSSKRRDEGVEDADASEEGYMVDEMLNALQTAKKGLTKDIADFEPNAKEYERIDELLNKYDSYELYRRIMGEVEARNIQKRMYMSPEMRRKTLLVSTEDIPRSEQINTSFSQETDREEPTFYSNAAHALEGLKQEKAKPEQWKAMLQKAGGLKAEEDKWVGISDWLLEQGDRTVTKQELADYIRENQIEVQDVNYLDDWLDIEENLNREFAKLRNEEEKKGNPDAINTAWNKLCKKYGNEDKHLFDSIYEDKSEIELLGDANTILKSFGYDSKVNYLRKDYTTRGLDTHREIALKVPIAEPYKNGNLPEVHFVDDATEGKAVAWIRFGDKTLPDGQKVLVIDEIQSQRHQDAREVVGKDENDKPIRRGYKDSEEYIAKETAYQVAQDELDWYEQYLSKKYGTDNIVDVVTDEEQAEISRLFNKEQQLYGEVQELGKRSNIPDAPFQSVWPELCMKRMLRYAAENGYDKIAWTGGELQAERYGIGHVVDHITAQKVNWEDIEGEGVPEGQYQIWTYDKDGDAITDASGRMYEAKIREVFGNGLAENIINEVNADKDGEPVIIEDKGLMIGGEGMQTFYDQMLPRFANKYGKKWGISVSDIELPGLKDASSKYENTLSDGQQGLVMHAIDVTPEMKTSVMEQGQPMWSQESPAAGLPHMGSKHAIAEKVVKDLPEAEDFYDLFGGGGAMAQKAFESGKYGQVHISDSDSRAMRLLTGALSGVYDQENRWISREDFSKLKEKDPYAAFAFSFWSNGQDYLYSKVEEAEKHALHQAIVDGNYEPYKKITGIDLSSIDDSASLADRYNEAKYLINDPQKSRLQSLDNLLRIQNLKNAELNLDVKTGDYRAMEIKPGSIVYADIPYEGTHGYTSRTKTEGFDSQEFRDWVADQEAQGTKVYVSGREIPAGFEEVGSYPTKGALGNVTEKVYRLAERPNGTEGVKWSQETGNEEEIKKYLFESPDVSEKIYNFAKEFKNRDDDTNYYNTDVIGILKGKDAQKFVKKHLNEITDACLSTFMEGDAKNRIDPDNFRNIFRLIGYDGTNVPDYQLATGKIMMHVFPKLVKEAVEKGKESIAFTSGIGGAGKSYAMRNGNISLDDEGVVYDGAFNKAKKLNDNIDTAVANGAKHIKVVVVHNDPITAFSNTLKRGEETGRFLGIGYFVSSYQGRIGLISDIIYHCESNGIDLSLIPIDNKNNKGKGVVSLEEARLWDEDYQISEETKVELLKIVENEIRSGRLTENQIASIAGDVSQIAEGSSPLVERMARRIEESISGNETQGRGDGQTPRLGINENKFSQEAPSKLDEDRSLVGVHNIASWQLEKALKMGGLANPSTAVIDAAKQNFDKYGDITLVMPTDLVEAKTGKHAGIYGADIYSPNYPQVYTVLTQKNMDKLSKWINDSVGDWEKARHLNMMYTFMDNVENGKGYNGLEYLFLKEKGITGMEEYRHDNFDNFWRPYVEKYSNGYDLRREMDKDPELKKAITEHLYSEKVTEYRRMLAKRHPQGDQDKFKWSYDLFKKAKDAADKLMDDGEWPYMLIDSAFEDNYKAFHNNGELLGWDTMQNAGNYVNTHDMRKEYDTWAQNLLSKYEPKERLYNGRDNQGRPRYLENNLQNASRLMKKEGLVNADRFFKGSMGGARAQLTPVMKTLEEIRENKWRLDEQAFEDSKEELQNEYSDLSRLFTGKGDGWYGIEEGYLNLQEAMLSGDSAKWAKKNGFKIDQEDAERIDDLAIALKEMPTGYFELKFDRPVGVDEFVAAVVPKDIPIKLKDQLADLGLNIHMYDPNVEGDRQRVLGKAAGENGALFSQETERDYQNAISSGDTEKQEELVKKVASIAMPNTAAVDKDGMPIMVYKRAGEKKDETTPWSYWSDKPISDKAFGDTIIKAYINIQKPLVIDAQGEYWSYPLWRELTNENDELPKTLEEARKVVKERGLLDVAPMEVWDAVYKDEDEWEYGDIADIVKGHNLNYDGVIIKNIREGVEGDTLVTDYQAMDPSQVKSADPITRDQNGRIIPLSERFDFTKKSMSFSQETPENETVGELLDDNRYDLRPEMKVSFSQETKGHSQAWKKAYDELKENGESVRILMDTEAHTIDEVAAEVLAGNKLHWNDKGEGEWRIKGAQAELGWGSGEKKAMKSLFDEENGMSIAKMGEAVEQACRDQHIQYDEDDANAGRNAIINVLQMAGAQQKPMEELRNYVENNRIAAAEEAEERFKEERDEYFREAYGMTYDEFADKFPTIVREKAPKTEKEKTMDWLKKRNARQAEMVQGLQKQLEDAQKLIKAANEKASAAEARMANAQKETERAMAARDTQAANAQRMYDAWRRANHSANESNVREQNAKGAEEDAKLLAQVNAETAANFEKAYQTIQEVKHTMTNIIKEQLSAEDMPFVTKKEINKLLSLVDKVNTPTQVDEAMDEITSTVAKGQERHLNYRLDKLLRMKTQDVNGRNMSVAKTVDNRTSQIIQNLREKLVNMEVSGMENQIDELYRRRRLKAAEIAEAKLNGGKLVVTDANGNSIQKSTSALQNEWDSISEEISQLSEKIEAARSRNTQTYTEELEEKRQALEAKLNDSVSENNPSVWTEKDSDELTTLRAMEHINEVKKIEHQIAQLHLEQSKNYEAKQIWKDRLAQEKTEEGKRKCRNMMRQADDAIKSNTREEVAAHETLVDALQQSISVLESMMENGRNVLREQVDADIQHRMDLLRQAFKDVRGKEFDISAAERKKKASALRQTFNLPLSSFDYMLQKIGTQMFGKEGFLYRHFFSGKGGVMDCHNEYIRGMEEQMSKLNAKVKEIFGTNNGMFGTDAWIKQKEQCETVKNKTGVFRTNPHDGNRYEIPLSQGQAMYIYMVWKQRDGRAKLEKQGFDQRSMAQIEDFIGDKYKQLADWIQDEFLPDTRAKYNEKYLQMYHTDMARIDNYVPLKIKKDVLPGQGDAEGTKKNGGTKKADLKQGSLINRTFNTLPIDYSWNAFDVILDHIQEQESWYAYAQIRRDLDTVANSPYFRAQLEANQPGTAERFQEAGMVATMAYQPEKAQLDEALAKMNKGLVAGNIAWRMNTALKQLLSAPAYLGYAANPMFEYYLAKNVLTGSIFYNWKWCVDNIDSFRERVNLGDLGDNRVNERLEDAGQFQHWLQKYASAGMIPNRIVDGLTCSIGVKTIYDYVLKTETSKIEKAKNLTPEEKAERLKEAQYKAKMEADIFYNETQQSSHPAFMSPTQMQKSLMARAMTTYQNSNLGYTRAMLESARDLAKTANFKKLYKNYTEYYMNEEGLEANEAQKKAILHIAQNAGGSINRLVLFGWIMKYVWNFGSKGFLGMYSNDDDDKKRKEGEAEDAYTKRQIASQIDDALRFGLTPFQGTPMGNMLMGLESEAAGKAKGGGWTGNQSSANPVLLISEVDDLFNQLGQNVEDFGYSPMLLATILNKSARLGGIDLETWSNIAEGVTMAVKDGHEYDDLMLDAMFILNTPKSGRSLAMKNIMKEEAAKGKVISPIEWAQKMAIAERYVNKANAWNQYLPWKKGEVTAKKAKEYAKQQYDAYHPDEVEVESKPKDNSTKYYEQATSLEDKLDDIKLKKDLQKYTDASKTLKKLKDDDKKNETDNAPDWQDEHQELIDGAKVISFYNKRISDMKKKMTGDEANDKKIVGQIRQEKKRMREALKDTETALDDIAEMKAEEQDRQSK